MTKRTQLCIGSVTSLLASLLLLVGIASAQGSSIYGQVIQPAPPTGTGGPAAFATVRICPFSGGGLPCSPTSSIFSDPTLTTPVANPYTSDQYGNYSVFVATGKYIVQITPIAGVTYSYLVFANGSATVSSVGLSLPGNVFLISGSPVTSSGTLTGSFITQPANTVFAAPSGSAGVPTFRALASLDIPWGSPGAIGSITPNTGAFTTLISPIYNGDTVFSGSEKFAKVNQTCFIDGVTITTLAQAITCAAGSGTIVVPRSAGIVTVPGTPTIPSGVTLTIEQGAILSVTTSLTIAGPLNAGLYQVFTGAGTVSFTSPGNEAISRPEWWGGKADGSAGYPITGTDNLAAFNSALAALPVYPGLPSQGPYTLVNGAPARTGRILLSPGRYVVSNTLILSPFTTYDCPSFNGCFLVLQNGVAASGPELWVVNVQALAGPSPNTSYGAQFRNISVDCNANVASGGTNANASGVEFNGAQGSSLGTLWIENCGQRGFWLQNSGSNLSGLGATSDLEVLGVTIGPGIQLDASVANFGTLRAEAVNPTGVNVDADGDPNPGLLIGSTASNGATNVNIEIFGAEFDALPLKVWSGNSITVQNSSIGSNTGGPMNTGIVISAHGANAISFGPMFTFAAAPKLFTNFIVDRSTTPTTTISGNFQDFPSLQGYSNGGAAGIVNNLNFAEVTTPTGAVANREVCQGNATTHTLQCSYNNGSFLNIPQIIASGTTTLGNTLISGGACVSSVDHAATGVTTADPVIWSYSSAAGTTGDGELVVRSLTTTNNVSFVVCNPTAGNITPSGLTVNWKVIR